MSRPEYFVFVCAQQRPAGHPRSSCSEKGAGQLLPAFSEGIIKRNLANKVSLVPTGCLGPCQAGANVLVFPGAHLYMAVQPEQIDEIIDSHLVEGKPVEALFAPSEIW